jgi:hypothetical protein
MKREQIIQILETWNDYILGGDINDDIADAIMALPIEDNKKDWYPPEFVKWLYDEYFMPEKGDDTFEELYIRWKLKQDK